MSKTPKVVNGKPIFVLDPMIEAFSQEAYNTDLVQSIWRDKYLQKKFDERVPEDAYQRVAVAIANSAAEKNPKEAAAIFYEMMCKRLFLPGGRILNGAGSDKSVTLMNCYVNGTLKDSLPGISRGKSDLWLTSAMGGGMGTDFSPLRPLGALIRGTGGASSGAVSFMDTFNVDGRVIRSANERRAAQMGTMSDTHPDLPIFIKAKGEGLKDGSMRLAEFNVSVWVSDAFRSAIEDDADWLLHFHIPPQKRDPELEKLDFEDDDGVTQYVYSKWRARELWQLIEDYTYEFSDPGVIFGDRVNDYNNLSYCETIRCTNPCGEQPLPPDGTCNLGAINVAQCVKRPFQIDSEIDFELIDKAARAGLRFLDNVIDVTEYPLPSQRDEEFNKRRVGLGLTGLGTMFAELRQRYGSQSSVQSASSVMKTICLAAYEESMRLADERGKFPLFQDIIVDCGFIKYQLPDEYKEEIKKRGLRNGVLLTIAPVGTGSIALGGITSGCEPDFSHVYERRTRRNNTEEYDVFIEKSYTARFYEFVTGTTLKLGDTLPDFMTSAMDLDIIDHIRVQGALQRWIDASVSKTINIPEDYPREKFAEVYDLAWAYGCKGCTTYRPSPYRDNILSVIKPSQPQLIELKRPEVLSGSTTKIKWASLTASVFITVNYTEEGKPYEIFFATKDATFQDWMTGLTLMISALLRTGVDPKMIPYELKQVRSTHDTNWDKGKFYGSLVARIAYAIEGDFIRHGVIQPEPKESDNPATQSAQAISPRRHGAHCPSCKAPALIKKEGCDTCENCGYSKCS